MKKTIKVKHEDKPAEKVEVTLHNHDGSNEANPLICKHQNQGEGKCFDCNQII